MARKLAVLIWMLIMLMMISDISTMYTSRLIHRFSDELRAFSGEKSSPEMNSKEYFQRMLIGDFERQKMKITHQQRQLLFPSQGSQTRSYGNDLGWYVFLLFFFLISANFV